MNRTQKRILQELNSVKDIFELLEKQEDGAVTFSEDLKALFDEGLVKESGGRLFLTDKSKVTRYNKIDSKQVLIKFKKISDKKPDQKEEFWQENMAEEDVIKKIKLMEERGDLKDNSFLIIGDDDLFSIALALVEPSAKIQVLEIDPNLVDFINKEAKKNAFNIKAQTYNVEDPFPKELISKFDVFVSEPVEALSGLKLFLKRGIASLHDTGVLYFGMTTIDSSLKKWQKLQRFLLEQGLVITDIFRNFSYYPEGNEKNLAKYYKHMKLSALFDFEIGSPKKTWYNSHLIRAQLLGKPKAYTNKENLGEDLYIDEEIVTFSKKRG